MSNNAPTGTIDIQGTLFRGETLTAVNNFSDADGLGSISYQWFRDGVAISGATNQTYALTGMTLARRSLFKRATPMGQVIKRL